MKEDVIDHPSHYESCANGGYEPIDLIDNYPFCFGTALKYLFRAGKKAGNSYEQDLKKARWYLRRSLGRDVYSDGAVHPISWDRASLVGPFTALIVDGKTVSPILKDLFSYEEGAYHHSVVRESMNRAIDKITEIVGEE